ncbi:MAG: lysylphosphatidylglycerol synthase domain-containing protein, partial [Haloarculaceae archaeon]
MTDPTDDRTAPDERAASDDPVAPDDHRAPDDPDGAATDGGSDPTDTGGSTPDDATEEFAPAADGAAVEPETDHRDVGEVSGLFSRDLLVKTVVGFAIALAFLYVLGMQAGWGEILATLAGVEPVWIVAGCLSTAVCLALWGKAWQVVLSVAGVDESYRRLVVTFYAATFANYVTPLGQAGGEPF